MPETTASALQKMCVVWSYRRERNLALRVYYELEEKDSCEVYTLKPVRELD